ncbi:MAG: DMT family transporter [Capsulimonadales bacterium]|nr:DMT family transporter [Capsulimonadales bacterium]
MPASERPVPSTTLTPVVSGMAILCCILWAGAYVTGKMAIGTAESPGFGPFRTAFFRFGLSGVLLALFLLWRDPAALALKREHWPGVIRLALFGLTLTYTFNYAGIERTTGTAAGLLIATEPVWIALLAVALLKERLTRARVLGIVFGLIGTILVTVSTRTPEPAADFSGSATFGNLLIVVSLLFESWAILTAKALTTRHRGITILTYNFLVGALMLSPFAAWETARFGRIHPSGEAWGAFAYLVVACSLFAYTMWYRLLEVADASELTVFLFLQPVLGTFLGVFWRGDPFNGVTLIGAFFVLAGMGEIVWQGWKRRNVGQRTSS